MIYQVIGHVTEFNLQPLSPLPTGYANITWLKPSLKEKKKLQPSNCMVSLSSMTSPHPETI